MTTFIEEMVYPGRTVIVPDNEIMFFGTITDVETISNGDILLEIKFASKTSFGAWVVLGPEVQVLSVNPYALPQLINMALDGNNKEDFMKYTEYLREWENAVEELGDRLYGYHNWKEPVR